MYSHILLPTDGSALSERAIGEGIKFARSINAKVTGFFAAPDPGTDYFFQDWRSSNPKRSRLDLDQMSKKRTERILSVIEERAREAGIAYDCFSMVTDSPHDAIIQTATDRGCDLIFMASHGQRGFSALLPS